MKKATHVAGNLRLTLCGALLGALTGCTTYVEQPRAHRTHYQEQPPAREVYVPPPPREETRVYQPPPPPMEVEASYVGIRTEADFYEPLSPHGEWVVIGSHGRCWRPARVDSNWRPYCNGHWVRCDAGWYWASEEPWGWATYHYGRWDYTAQFGWFWVPQTQWAPAWVSWHRGGGYVGWAPLYPSARVGGSGYVEVDRRVIAPRAYVIVEERRFMEPVRPTTVVVNNTTIINKTVNITKVKVVNKTVINEGPQTEVIEQVSGRKVQAEPVRDLRRKGEAGVVVTHGTQKANKEKKEKHVEAPARSTAEPIETKAASARELRQVEQPAATSKELQAPAPKQDVRETDQQKREKASREEEKRARKAQEAQAEDNTKSAVTPAPRPAEQPAATPQAVTPARKQDVRETDEQKRDKAAREEEKRARKAQEQQAEIEKRKRAPVATETRPPAGPPAEVRETPEQQVEKQERRVKEAAESDKGKRVPATPELKPPSEHPAATKQTTEQKTDKLTGKEKKQAKELEKQTQRDAERRAMEAKKATKQDGTNTVDKVRQNKGEEQQTTEQPPAAPPASQ